MINLLIISEQNSRYIHVIIDMFNCVFSSTGLDSIISMGFRKIRVDVGSQGNHCRQTCVIHVVGGRGGSEGTGM